MRSKILLLMTIVLMPTVVNAQLFEKIHNKQVITIVLTSGRCDGKVARVAPDELIVKLKRTTAACGHRGSLVMLSRSDVQHVVDNRPRGQRPDPSPSPAAVCTVVGTTIVAATAGLYLGETNRGGQALAAIIGGGIASGILCHGVFFHRAPRFSVFSDRISPIQP